MGFQFLLVSDVDNTLLGDDNALEAFGLWHAERKDSIKLVYNSGRFCSSVRESLRLNALPEPVAIIGGVGTEIELFPSGERLSDWPLEKGWDAEGIRAVLAAHQELEPQPEHLQSSHKISCYGYDLPKAFLTHLQTQCESLGYLVEIVYSSNRDLDVLPANTNKGTAAMHLAAHLQMRDNQVIVAGDSANDLAMFQQSFAGIVVSNAHSTLKELSGQTIFHAQASFAAGVLEGLEYWTARLAPIG